jgi:hypothetical protein
MRRVDGASGIWGWRRGETKQIQCTDDTIDVAVATRGIGYGRDAHSDCHCHCHSQSSRRTWGSRLVVAAGAFCWGQGCVRNCSRQSRRANLGNKHQINKRRPTCAAAAFPSATATATTTASGIRQSALASSIQHPALSSPIPASVSVYPSLDTQAQRQQRRRQSPATTSDPATR